MRNPLGPSFCVVLGVLAGTISANVVDNLQRSTTRGVTAEHVFDRPSSDTLAPEAGWSVRQRHQRQITAHNEEAVDEPWATTAATTLREDLATSAARGGCTLVALDCRTKSCVGTVRWPSSHQASHQWRGLLHQPMRANCTRSLLLEDAPEPGGPIEATVIFNCQDSRNNGSPLVPALASVAAGSD
jgi:hypothetical protein